MDTRTIGLLRDYLKAIQIGEKDYTVEAVQDTMGFLVTLTIKKDHPSIGVLRGKNGQNLDTFKSLLRIVGATERIRPSLKLKFTE
jgi:predicted RNA-binding protein YlqC (UPF0109 family)